MGKAKLQVYGVNYDGITRRVTAANSRTEAAKKIGVALTYMQQMGAVTGNDIECALCLSNPDRVYSKCTRTHNNEWKQVTA